MAAIPYCGLPPEAGTLASRWNGDPVLIAALCGLALFHILRTDGPARVRAAPGWAVASLAFVSPLCALSVSLFSARVAQHMVLILIAAPLIASTLPPGKSPHRVWPATIAFFIALWAWHMPGPYDLTLHSTPVYWAMHISLFCSAIWLWRELLHHSPEQGFQVLAAGTVTSVQMSLLGAVLALASHAMFRWHYFTTQAWGFSPLSDQQLGGVLMWVPGCLLFLWVAVRSTALLASLTSRPGRT